MTTKTDEPRGAGARRYPSASVAIFALLVVMAGGFGLYEITRPPGKAAAKTGLCARSLAEADAIAPFAHGEVAALMPARTARDLSAVSFDDAAGHKVSVAAFAGRTVLLNLWATWCVPCRAEMPALDRLEAQRGSAAFAVIPVDVDQLRLEKARAFFKDNGVLSLPYYADASADILRALNSQGLPTTILVGADGCEVATMAGPAKWDSPEAEALIDRVSGAKT